MRIQKKNFNDNDWKNNSNAVYIGRPSQWGNPFKVEDYGRTECLNLYRNWLIIQLAMNPYFLEPLRGKDLVCFCKLNEQCHGDIITEFLNLTETNKQTDYLVLSMKSDIEKLKKDVEKLQLKAGLKEKPRVFKTVKPDEKQKSLNI